MARRGLRRKCPQCGNKFTLKAPNQLYCCSQCKDSHNYTPTYHNKVCIRCGITFRTSNKALHCTKECARIHKVERLQEKRNATT
jgi:hypothetical protein